MPADIVTWRRKLNLTQRQEQKIQTSDMSRVKRIDKIRNADISDLVEVKSAQTILKNEISNI